MPVSVGAPNSSELVSRKMRSVVASAGRLSVTKTHFRVWALVLASTPTPPRRHQFSLMSAFLRNQVRFLCAKCFNTTFSRRILRPTPVLSLVTLGTSTTAIFTASYIRLRLGTTHCQSTEPDNKKDAQSAPAKPPTKFDKPAEWSFPSLPDLTRFSLPDFAPFDGATARLEDATARLEDAWRKFPEQMAALKESIDRWWDLVDVEQAKRLVKRVEEEAKDTRINPEVEWEARVRRGSTLCPEEQSFLTARRHRIRKRFAEFIGVNEEEVHEEDLPVIGIAASGGGYRAMIASSGMISPRHARIRRTRLRHIHCRYASTDSPFLISQFFLSISPQLLLSSQLSPLTPLSPLTLPAAISGSCWTLSLLYSTLTQPSESPSHLSLSPTTLLNHLRPRLTFNPTSFSHLTNLASVSEENQLRLVQGVLRRYGQVGDSVGLVDLTGAALGGILLTEEGGAVIEEEGKKVYLRLVKPEEVKLSRQRRFVTEGENPLPIYCSVRHEMPEGNDAAEGMKTESDGKKESYFQWFELTPFEIGSEEFNGASCFVVWLKSDAFTFSYILIIHITTILIAFAYSTLAWIPTWSFGRHFEAGRSVDRTPEQDLPIMMGLFGSAFAATLAHYYKEMRGLLPPAIVERIDGVVKEYDRSLSTIHPISPGSFPNPFLSLPPTPPSSSTPPTTSHLHLCDAGLDNNVPFHPLLRPGRACDVILALDMSADIQTAPWFERAEGYARRREVKGWPADARWREDEEMGPCVVFPSESKEVVEGEVMGEKPLTLIYLPLIANPGYAEGKFDPQTSVYCSTFNFVYDEAQVDELEGLARRNWEEGVGRVREEVRKISLEVTLYVIRPIDSKIAVPGTAALAAKRAPGNKRLHPSRKLLEGRFSPSSRRRMYTNHDTVGSTVKAVRHGCAGESWFANRACYPVWRPPEPHHTRSSERIGE
ncbi:acyl transferase/acyl hydrolase/lysophospholipase, partial [Jimgerdemannia flammicorona]